MTDEELKAIEERLQAATPGPWEIYPERRETFPGYSVEAPDPHGIFERVCVSYQIQLKTDARFIANAPQDIARLLAEVKRLKAESEALRSEARKADFTDIDV